jgi:glucose/arabinose dehydrogenase
MALMLLLCAWPATSHAQPPPNFAVEDVLTGLEQPIAIRFLPDGRMLLVHKKGPIWIVNVQTNPVQSAVYMDLTAAAHGLDFDQERGVLDIAIDPAFPTQPYIYIFYTPTTGPAGGRARVSRFTHLQNAGGVASRGDLTSEVILWQDTQGYDSCCHFGGGLDFGPDGHLWLATGDHFQGSYASSLQHAGGKVHRFTKTGAVPAGNPYADGAGPNVDTVFAYGLRNPFRMRWDLPTGRLYIAEVGGNTQSIAWEDLHVIQYDRMSGRFVDDDYGTPQDNFVYDGINFGWPTVEGLPPHDDFPGWVIDAVGEPVFAYKHAGSTAAINGGLVYRGTMFPTEYVGAYFYADSTRDFVRYLKFNPDGSVAPNPNPAAISLQNPDTTSYSFDLEPVGRIVSIDVGPEGALYYVSFTDSGGAYGEPNPSVLGAVRRYVYDAGNARPVINQFIATPASGASPLAVTFSVAATDPESDPMTFAIDFGDGVVTAAAPLAAGTVTTVQHTYQADGAYQARVSVSDLLRTSSSTTTVSVGTPPVVTALTSTNPRPGATSNMFRFGDTLTFSASASDAEDGVLGASSFSWYIVFVRPGNIHPVFGPADGLTSIQFPIPDQGQGFSGPVYYRIYVTVTDSSGLSTSSWIDVFPEKSNISFTTVPSGIVIQVNGNTAQPAPFVLDTLINYDHVITAPASVCVSGTNYSFVNWSNGPTTPQQVYNVPPTDSALTATYAAGAPCANLPTSGLVLHLKNDAGVILNGSNVTAWEDQTANNNVLSAVGSPTFVSGALNGFGVIQFDGIDDALARNGMAGLPTGSADRSVFMVVRYNAATTSQAWAGFAYGQPSSNNAFGLALTPSGHLGVQGWGSNNDFVTSPAAPGVGEWLVQGAVVSNGTLTQYKGEVAHGTVSHVYSTATGSIRLGEELNGGLNLNMGVAEIVVFNRAVSPTELQQINSYFETRYALAGGTGNTAPTVTITSPANNATFTAGAAVSLQATASDTEDGTLTAALAWTSDRDGALGTGGSVTVSTLSVGTHIITAAVTDSGGLTGSATRTITVTEGSGGSGQLITSGLVVQLEADLNVSLQSGTTVAGWLDQSGLGNDLVASGTPQWVATGTPTGQAAIRLNGAGDKLERLNATDPLGGLPAANGNRTMFVVAKYDGASAWGGAAYGTGGANQAFGLVVTPSGPLTLQGWGGGNDLVSTTAGIGAGWLIQAAVLASGTATLYKDDSQIAQWTHTYNTVLTRLVIGEEIAGLGFVDMDVAAVLIYNRALSATERASVGAYLRSKYLTAASGNTAPSVTITAPANNATFTAGTAISLAASASDTEDGNLTSAIAWTSDRDGVLGTGGSLTVSTLSVGTHVLTAAVTDSGGLGGSALRTIIVTAVSGNTAPTVTITSPANNATFTAGAAVSLQATASDTEDGTLTAALAWTSDRDGFLGTGGSVTVSTLSVGTHVLTAAVTDSGGLTGSATRTVTVTATPAISLTARGYKVKGVNTVDLTWTNASSSTVQVYRNGVSRTVSNSGSLTDNIGTKGSGTYVYKVCETGTAKCSNEVTVVF